MTCFRHSEASHIISHTRLAAQKREANRSSTLHTWFDFPGPSQFKKITLKGTVSQEEGKNPVLKEVALGAGGAERGGGEAGLPGRAGPGRGGPGREQRAKLGLEQHHAGSCPPWSLCLEIPRFKLEKAGSC